MSEGGRLALGVMRGIYLGADDEVPLELSPIRFDLFEDQSLRAHPRIRRVLLSFPKSDKVYALWLHWSDGTDLISLDSAIARGEVPAELDGALIAQTTSIGCGECGVEMRGLVPDTGMSWNTTARIQSHTFVRRCPICNDLSNMLVLEYLYPDEHDTTKARPVRGLG
jgi:hypothetical protein